MLIVIILRVILVQLISEQVFQVKQLMLNCLEIILVVINEIQVMFMLIVKFVKMCGSVLGSIMWCSRLVLFVFSVCVVCSSIGLMVLMLCMVFSKMGKKVLRKVMKMMFILLFGYSMIDMGIQVMVGMGWKIFMVGIVSVWIMWQCLIIMFSLMLSVVVIRNFSRM